VAKVREQKVQEATVNLLELRGPVSYVGLGIKGEIYIKTIERKGSTPNTKKKKKQLELDIRTKRQGVAVYTAHQVGPAPSAKV